MSKPEDVDRLYATVADSGRRIDVVFANAAILEVARIGDITEDQLDYQLGVDFKGVVFTVQKALPLLNDGGSIILNASTTAARAADGISVYGAIKAAVRSFARTWASELRDRKIRVNAVSPGATDTPGIDTLARMLFPGPNAEEQFEDYQRSIVPMARLRNPGRGRQRRTVPGVGSEQLHHRRRHPRRRRHQPDLTVLYPASDRVCTRSHGVSTYRHGRSRGNGS